MKRVVVIAISAILVLSLAAPIAYAQVHHKHNASPSTSSQGNQNQSNQNQDNKNPGVIPPDQADYAKLSTQWWQWAYSIPAPDNPLNNTSDTSGTKCANRQTGKTWFLGGLLGPDTGGGGTATRTCNVPVGTQLFFPVFNVECATVEGNPPPPDPSSSLSDCAKYIADQALNYDGNKNHMIASLDGVPIKKLINYRAASGPFTFTLPDNNVDPGCSKNGQSVPCPAGTSPAAADGVYLLLAPLPAGQHTLKFGGKFPLPPSLAPGGGTLNEDITYTLNVS